MENPLSYLRRGLVLFRFLVNLDMENPLSYLRQVFEDWFYFAFSYFVASSPTKDSDERLSLSQPVVSHWCGQPIYGNPWSTWNSFSSKIIPLIKWLWKLWRRPPILPSKTQLDEMLPVVEKDDILREIKPKPESDQVRVTWLGHATVMLQFETANVLCDPVFTDRLGPPWPLPFAHCRYRRPPLKVEDLPDIDAVVISHNHHDHLDFASVKDLHERFAEKIQWFVPMGLKEWMVGVVGVEERNVTELTWWERSVLTLRGKDITFTFTPTQHWCLRGFVEVLWAFCGCKVLWGSWAICSTSVKTWFGGDTGYCETFKEIGEEFGGFDLAAIPVGAYLPRDVMRDQHVEPKESVMIHQDLKSKKSVGIHWGTFGMGCLEGAMDPKHELERETKLAGVPQEDFFLLDHGGSALVTAE